MGKANNSRKPNIVYILRNEAFPDYIKIGITGNLEERMKSLDCTSTPLPFVCDYAADVGEEHAKFIEDSLHHACANNFCRDASGSIYCSTFTNVRVFSITYN